MQINFNAKKLKEANEYVDHLQPKKKKNVSVKTEEKPSSVFKRIFKFLFK